MDALKFERQATELRNQGKGYEAVEVYQQAKEAYLAKGELTHAAGCQHMIGVSYKIENDLKKAVEAYNQAVIDYQTAGNTLGPGRVERDLGIMYEYHDRFTEAEKHLLQSRHALERLPGDQKSAQSVGGQTCRDAELGITLAKIGLLYTRTGKFEEAEGHLIEGLTLIRGVGHPFYELTALLHMSALYIVQGHPGRALANAQASLGLVYEHGLKRQQTRRLAQIWGAMAHCYLALGNEVTARHFTLKAISGITGLSEKAQAPVKKDMNLELLRQKLAV